MRTTVALALLLGLPATASAAAKFDKPAPRLDEVLEKARATGKPALLYMSTIWCGPCKRVMAELEKPDNQKMLLDSFVFQVYDAERGEGAAIAPRYTVGSYPTLLVLDGKGTMIVRQVGLDPARTVDWLKTSAQATVTDAQLDARVKAKPDDLEALWLLANRALARKDGKTARAYLAKIEAADKSPEKEAAMDAAWRRVESAAEDRLREESGRELAAIIPRYPGFAWRTVTALVAVGADDAAVESAITSVLEVADKETALGVMVPIALSIGAKDLALRVAEKGVALEPDDAGRYIDLADAREGRGEMDEAVAAMRKAFDLTAKDPKKRAYTTKELARLEKGEREPLERSMRVRPLGPTGPPRTVETIASLFLREFMPGVSKSCQASAKNIPEAYAYVSVGKTAVETVKIMEPKVPAALDKCLTKAIRAIPVPADTKPARVVMTVTFGL